MNGQVAGMIRVSAPSGKLDEQSLHGKVPAGVIRRARDVGAQVAILCGRSEVHPERVLVGSLAERFGERRAMTDTARSLEDLAAAVADRWVA